MSEPSEEDIFDSLAQAVALTVGDLPDSYHENKHFIISGSPSKSIPLHCDPSVQHAEHPAIPRAHF